MNRPPGVAPGISVVPAQLESLRASTVRSGNAGMVDDECALYVDRRAGS